MKSNDPRIEPPPAKVLIPEQRKPCLLFVRQWRVGDEWLDTVGHPCPRCGFDEAEHPDACPVSAEKPLQ